MAEYADKMMVALKDAMRNKETERRNTIRLLQAAFKQVQVDEQRELSAEDEVSILEKEAKKRRESIEELESVGRTEDAQAEQAELDVILGFMPEQLTEEEIRAMAQDAVDQVGATEMRDMGKVMGVLVPKTKGRAEGSRVSAIVREILNS